MDNVLLKTVLTNRMVEMWEMMLDNEMCVWKKELESVMKTG